MVCVIGFLFANYGNLGPETSEFMPCYPFPVPGVGGHSKLQVHFLSTDLSQPSRRKAGTPCTRFQNFGRVF